MLEASGHDDDNDYDYDNVNAHIIKHCLVPERYWDCWQMTTRNAGENNRTPISHQHDAPCVAIETRPRPYTRQTSLLIYARSFPDNGETSNLTLPSLFQ